MIAKIIIFITSLFQRKLNVSLCESKQASQSNVYTESEFIIAESAVADATLPPGSVWDVTPIRVGKSKNRIKIGDASGSYFYPQETLDKSASLFEGAQVFAHKGGPHVEPNQKSVHDEVGWISNVASEPGQLRARLNILPSAQWLRENLLAAHRKGKKDLYQLSIHANGNAYQKMLDGENVFYVESIDHVDSLDVVPKGAAGGQFNQLIESHHNHGAIPMNAVKSKLLLLFSLLYPTFLESKNVDYLKVNENELFTYLMEADKAQPRLHLPEGSQLTETLEALDSTLKQFESLHRQQAQSMLNLKLTESRLPVPLQDAIKKRFEGKLFTEAEIADAIKTEKELYGKLFPNTPQSIYAEAGMDQQDKVMLGLDGFFLCSPQALKPVKPGTDEAKTLLNNIPPIRSMKEAYVLITGDNDVSGIVGNKRRLTEAVDTTQFAKAVADAMNKRLVRDYIALGLDTWRAFVDIVPLNDFKTQHRIRFGGYSNLPTVGQGASYAPLASPTDEEVTYAPAKKGGTESITREAIMNDDVGSIQKIPTRMARAAAQTLHEFVYDLINPAVNPTYEPDSTSLYHTNHANKGTSALDATSLAAARLRMKKQVMAGSNKRIGIRARYLVVPPDLEKTAYELLTPAFDMSNATPEFIQQVGIIPIVVDYWTDADNWCLAGDRADVSGVELGFVNGQETPEVFVSDLTNVGSWFTNDQITYKIRHEYGGDLLDYRAFDGSIVG